MKCQDYYVYQWTGPTGSYIGKGRGRRSERHIRLALGGSKACPKFYNAIRAHGPEAFSLEYLVRDLGETEAFRDEVLAVYVLEPEYNLTAGGEGASGLKHTDETRRKMALWATGRSPTEETKAKISRAKANVSDETRGRLSAAGKGRRLPPFTAEHREKISISLTGRKKPPAHVANSASARRARLTPQREEVLRLVSEGVSQAEAARRVGVSRMSVWTWCKAVHDTVP